MPRRNQRPVLPELTVVDVARLDPPFIPQARSLLTPRERMNPAHRARVEREEARAALTECAMPLCTSSPVLDDEGHNLGICRACMLDIAHHLAKRAEEYEPVTEARLKREHAAIRRERHEQQMRESRALTPGWIYYARLDDQIKIGYSTNVRQRMKSYPPRTRLLVVHPGTKTLEHELHEQFANLLAAGREWFHPGQELIDHIADALRQFGEPESRHIYRYREGTKQTIRPRRSSR